MRHNLYNMRGYAHLYKSLLRFCGISSFAAKELCYMLNLANIDTHIAYTGRNPREYGKWGFFLKIKEHYKAARPYRTEVQLYKSMEALVDSIDISKITGEQREAVLRLRCLMRDIELSFFKTFLLDITDAGTVYAVCAADLIPRKSEPSVCMLSDWQSLTPVLLINKGRG